MNAFVGDYCSELSHETLDVFIFHTRLFLSSLKSASIHTPTEILTFNTAKTRDEIFFVVYFIYLFIFTTPPLESSCVHQSNPPEHVASASGQSDSFQPEASFSFAVGRKQWDTQENSREAKILKTAETWWTKNKIKHTSSLCVESRKPSQSSLLSYYCCKW